MSVISQRAIVGRALFDMQLDARFRQWMTDTAPGAVDQDGDIVTLPFGDDEPARALLTESAPHPHDVVMCTLHNGQIAAWVLGPALARDVEVEAEGVPVDEGMTVGDLVDLIIELEDGAQFVLEFAGQRHMASSFALAA